MLPNKKIRQNCVIFFVKPLPPSCSHANSNMSSRQNFKNPTHGSEVVNATIFAPLAPLGLAGPSVPKIPKKFHQIAQNKQEKIVKKKNLGKFVPQNIFLVAVGVSSKFLFRQP
jgi:hypothetical protein